MFHYFTVAKKLEEIYDNQQKIDEQVLYCLKVKSGL